MRIGINTFLFTSPFTDRSTKLFAQFARWGFDCVEISVEQPHHINPAHVKRELEKHGLQPGPVCACFPPDRDLRGTKAQQQNAVNYICRLVDIAVLLGSSGVAGPMYSATGRADAVEPRELRKQWATVVKHLRRICNYAAARGKKLYLEPLNRFETDFLNTVAQGLELIEAVGSPALQLHLDTFHLNIEEKSQAAAIRKAGKHLGHFHACGSDRGTPGGDHTDWKGIAAALKAAGYEGDVVIESFTQDVKVIARAAAIWRKIEPSREEIARKGLKFLRRTLK
jgi:D-psicose/D-tagatose/L-ribulose 3-epimerase